LFLRFARQAIARAPSPKIGMEVGSGTGAPRNSPVKVAFPVELVMIKSPAVLVKISFVETTIGPVMVKLPAKLGVGPLAAIPAPSDGVSRKPNPP